jgi:HEAT repeat protein
MHTEPKLVVPVMINVLRGPDASVRMNAIECLGLFGADARAAVPALSELLKRPNLVFPNNGKDYMSEKSLAAEALRLIAPEAASKAAAK